MKRAGNLWPQIIEFENLLLAAQKAQRGKRFRPNVLAFNDQLESELFRLQKELIAQTYQPGGYRTFEIYEPKPRLISAAPYRDRVVHHALCNVIGPILEQGFIHQSYANRQGYGTHRAMSQFIQYARTNHYVLQCDIQKYFPSIDHLVLKSTLRQTIKCSDILWLIDTIIDNSNPQIPVIDYFPGDDLLTPVMRRKGLPIGNLTSQFFANCYLNNLDHFVKRKLHAKQYLRYVDDFALFSDDHGFLTEAKEDIIDFLAGLRLKIHPVKSQLFKTAIGANFVGFRILPCGTDHPKDIRIRVRNDNLRRGRLRLRQLQQDYQSGKIEALQLQRSIESWQAHLAHADSFRLCRKIFEPLKNQAGFDIVADRK
jgi:RNA-directed DNA polymerase